MYEDGEDASKAVYIAKMEEIRAMAGPISQRYFDKVEQERAAKQAQFDAEAAAKRSNTDAKKAEEKTEEPAKDETMTDAPQPETEEK